MKLPKFQKKTLHRIASIAIILFGSLEPFLFTPQTHAVAATGYIRLDRMAIGLTGIGGLVCTTPQTTATEGKVVITFPATGASADGTHFGVNQTTTNWTLATANIPTGATAWPGVGSNPSAISGGAITIASGDLTVGTQYCFTWSGASTLSTNTTSAQNNLTGTIQTQTSGGSAIDTINVSLGTVSNDQIIVTGTVPSTFSFSLSGNSATFSTNIPTTSSPATTPSITATVSTNAQNGWIIWAKNTNANSALVSSSTSDGICFGGNYSTCTGAAFQTGAGNVHSLSSAAGYGMSATSGTATIATEYTGSATSFGSLDNTKFEKVASETAPASSHSVALTFGAEASATNKAATDYTDTVTVTAAGQF